MLENNNNDNEAVEIQLDRTEIAYLINKMFGNRYTMNSQIEG